MSVVIRAVFELSKSSWGPGVEAPSNESPKGTRGGYGEGHLACQ